MRSPFPGMDPYLERHWRDVHCTLVVHASGTINRQMNSHLRARINERWIIEQGGYEARERYIEIIDPTDGGKAVTLLEFVSPANKLAEEARRNFIRKQLEAFYASMNLVVVDLTRSGRREWAYPPNGLPKSLRATYVAWILRLI